MLTKIVFLPLLLSLLVLVVPSRWVRLTALISTIGVFVLSLFLLFQFDKTSAALQLVETKDWVSSFGIKYFLGIDGISLWLVILTTFLTPLMILGSWTSITERVRSFHFFILFLETAMLGTFVAMDAILFYTFFEASLIPMYFMVGIWGGARRLYAAMKFFIFTMSGSVLMLVAIIAMMLMTESQFGTMSASLLDFYKLDIPFIGGTLFSPQTLMFFAFSLAFAIKVPMFPVHTWLPDAHVEAPTAGSVVLAGVMLKMGTYGFVRMVLPMFPEAVSNFGWIFLLLGALGIVYGALVAMVQPDIKKLVAYSSVSHMGYVVLGLFAMNTYGITGGIFQMLNHGVSTGALFLLVGMIYERTHSREIVKYGGLARVMPVFTICFFIVTLSSIAVPGTNGFVGEVLILMGGFMANKGLGAIAVVGVVLGAAYMLWMFKRVFFGKPGELTKESLLDLNLREILTLAPLLLLVFWMGIFPNQFLDWSKSSIDHLVKNSQSYTLAIHQQTSENLNDLIAEANQ